MRVHPLWVLPVVALSASACVTINIYFPAAAAEKIADKIVQDVYKAGGKPKGAPERQPAEQQPTAPAESGAPQHKTPPQSRLDSPEKLAQAVLMRTLTFISGTAEAAEANINIDTPAVRQLRQSLEARAPQLKPLFDAGALGLTSNGLVTIKDAGKLPLAQRAQASSLVQAENADRMALYKAIAEANGHPEWEKDIQQTFAASWIKNAEPGWWYQGPGGWQRK